MEPVQRKAPERRFAGRNDPAEGVRRKDWAALAEVLLSGPAATKPAAAESSPAATAVAEARPRAAPPTPEASPPSPPSCEESPELYIMIPSGIEPALRRGAALAAARRMAAPGRPGAVLLFDEGRVDAHVLGDAAGGRLGPQNTLGGGDLDRSIAGLAGQCGSIGLVLMGGAAGSLHGLDAAARRTVFLTAPDAESIVETYRELKTWRQHNDCDGAAVFLVGGDDDGEAEAAGRRLQAAARQFLGCELALQGTLATAAATPTAGHPEPLCVFSHAPAEDVSARLLAAVGVGEDETDAPVVSSRVAYSGGRLPEHETGAPDNMPRQTAAWACHPAEHGPSNDDAHAHANSRVGMPPVSMMHEPETPAAGPVGSVCPVFSVWHPADRNELLAAIEAQAPSDLAPGLLHIFRVEIDEPGAPPLAGVRADGALVAILVRPSGAEGVRSLKETGLQTPAALSDTRAAEAWLAVHRPLVARAFPSSRITAAAGTAAIVLEPLAPPAGDGVRRFVPIRQGGHRGILLLP